MNNIKEFNNRKELIDFIMDKDLTFLKLSGTSTCYYSESEGTFYKIIAPDYKSDKKGTNIITTNTLNKEYKYFLFPTEVFTVSDNVVGYTTKPYIHGDIFNDICFSKNRQLNFSNLISAYEAIKEEVESLATENVFVYDLPYNLLFNNKSLYGIDTIAYFLKQNLTTTENVETLELAIKSVFKMWAIERDVKKAVNEISKANMQDYFMDLEKIYHSSFQKKL